MRIGVGGGGGTIDAAVDSVRQAKDAGYHSAWFSNIFGLDGMTACAVAGREVPDITLGTFVVPTYSRHPLYMAQQAMSTQAATGGRFILGIGLSHQIVIEGILGLSSTNPPATWVSTSTCSCRSSSRARSTTRVTCSR